MNRWSIVVVMGIAAALGCSTDPKPVTTTLKTDATRTGQTSETTQPEKRAVTSATNGLSATDRTEYDHLPEGGELLPLDMLRAVVSTRTNKPFFENIERFRLILDPADPDGLPVGMSAAMINGKRTEPRMVFFNCSACHTAELTFQGMKVRVDGAAAQFDMSGFVTELLESVRATVLDPQKLADFLTRSAKQQQMELEKAYPDLKLKGDPKDFLEKVTSFHKQRKKFEKGLKDVKLRVESATDALNLLQEKLNYLQGLVGLKVPTPPGYGRVDAFMGARNLLFGEKYAVPLNSPVSFPPIHGLAKLTWYHYDNNTTSIVQRNIGEDLGVGAVVNTSTGESSVQLRNLIRLETLATKITTPQWPAEFGALDASRTARGAAIYKQQCASCHDYGSDGMFPDRVEALDKIGTDPNRAANFANNLGPKTFPESLHGVLVLVQNKAMARENISAEEVAKVERARIEWRATNKYSSRPLAGIWASAPYLHNGSVPTLYDLLLPPDKRPKTFHTGSREFDPKKVGYVSDGSQGGTFELDTTLDGNHNTGHTYGTDLTEDQRWDLIEYIKSM